MTGLDRRLLMKGALATAAAFSGTTLARAAGQRAGVFVANGRFAASAAAARDRSWGGMAVIDTGEEDLGMAWRQRIPRLLERNGAKVEGITLWSELVICQTFARTCGLAVVQPPDRAASAAGVQLWYWQFARPGSPAWPAG